MKVMNQKESFCQVFVHFPIYLVKNQEMFKLNGTHQHRVYAVVNLLGESICTIKKNIEALVVISTLA
jgi:hypothetical protein